VEEVNGVKFLVLHAGRVLAEVSVDNKDQITFCRQQTDYENGRSAIQLWDRKSAWIKNPFVKNACDLCVRGGEL
jgi:hypothetical protein